MTEEFDLEPRLRAADRPRPLPAALRARLEEQLTNAGATEAVPLDPAAAGRLARRLTDAAPAPSPRRPGRAAYRLAGVAAACLLLGGVAALAELGSGPQPSTAASRARSAAPGTPSVAGSSAAGGSPVGAPAPPTPLPQSAGPAFAGSALAAPAGPPVISSLSPSSGPAAGGTWVTITGSHLAGVTAVHFGTADAAQFRFVSDGEVLALSPPHPAGAVGVEVVTAAGAGRTAPTSGYTYTG